MRKILITNTRNVWPVPPAGPSWLAGRLPSNTKGEEGKGRRVYFTQMPIREVRADNKRADVCCFLSRSTGQERDMLDLLLLSSLPCLKWQQARNPSDLKPLPKLSAPAVTHTGTRQTCFARVVQTLPRPPAHAPARHGCRRGRRSFTPRHPTEGRMQPRATITRERRSSRILLFWRKTRDIPSTSPNCMQNQR